MVNEKSNLYRRIILNWVFWKTEIQGEGEFYGNKKTCPWQIPWPLYPYGRNRIHHTGQYDAYGGNRQIELFLKSSATGIKKKTNIPAFSTLCQIYKKNLFFINLARFMHNI